MNRTKIQWCDLSWNPITGCSPVSAGCNNCYAAAIARRFNGGDFSVKFHPERLDELKHVKKPARIFVCSMSDFFHAGVRPEWQEKILDRIFANSLIIHHYFFLTKRPERIPYWPQFQNPHLWVGASLENQEVALKRVHLLCAAEIHNRFLSVEPMIGPVDIGTYLATGRIKWVICGRETGQGARPFNYAWAAMLYEQCLRYGVPFFFKNNEDKKYHWKPLPMEYPESLKP